MSHEACRCYLGSSGANSKENRVRVGKPWREWKRMDSKMDTKSGHSQQFRWETANFWRSHGTLMTVKLTWKDVVLYLLMWRFPSSKNGQVFMDNLTWLIGCSCTLRVLPSIWSTEHGQTMRFWLPKVWDCNELQNKMNDMMCARKNSQNIQTHPSPAKKKWPERWLVSYDFFSASLALQAVLMGRLTRHWVNGIMVQMLGTHPDAFHHPSRLDRVEERPTSRSAAWEEKDMDQSYHRMDGKSEIWWNLGFWGDQTSLVKVWLEV